MHPTKHASLEAASHLALIGLALTLSVVLIRREFFPPGEEHDHGSGVMPEPLPIAGWENWSSVGRWIGDSTAPVRLVVFGDYECPYCAQFDSAFHALRDSIGETASILYIHFPLSYHEWAIPAAQIAECAAEQSAFEPMHEVLYREQRKSPNARRAWGQLIREVSGIEEGPFMQCMNGSQALERIAMGRSLGDSLGLNATPTILINGDLYPALPPDQLPAAIAKYASR